MNELSCGVVRDLLPLYAENMTSDESCTLIETDLENCEACREELAVIQKTPNIEPKTEESLRHVKRKLRWKKIMIAVASIALAGVMVAGMLGLSIIIHIPVEITPADISTGNWHGPISNMHFSFQTILLSRAPFPNANEDLIQRFTTDWYYDEDGAIVTEQVIFLTSNQSLFNHLASIVFPDPPDLTTFCAVLEDNVYRINPNYAEDLSGCCDDDDCWHECTAFDTLPPLIPTERLRTTRVYFVPYRQWHTFPIGELFSDESMELATLLWCRATDS